VIVCFVFSLLKHFELIGAGLEKAGVAKEDFPRSSTSPATQRGWRPPKEAAAIKAEAREGGEKK